mgnify:CR=1 FL=1
MAISVATACLCWHKLTSNCDNCGEELVIEELFVNSESEFKFHLVCPDCDTQYVSEITANEAFCKCLDLDLAVPGNLKN